MSFFARLGSDSDSDSSGSESEESILSGDEGEEQDKRIASKPKNNKASMFLRSDAEESSEEEESDEDDDEELSEGGSDVQRQSMANRFLRDAASSDEDSDEEDKTVVLSAKDKRFVEMDTAIQNIKNATKAGGAANDWVLTSSELDKLLRFITRHQASMVSSPIPPAGHIPPQFLATIVELDASVTSTYSAEKNATKKMPAPKSKALNGMRQTLKKKNKELEVVLGTYNQDPEAYASEYAKANVAPVVPKAPKRAAPEAGQEEGQEGQDENFSTVGRGGRVRTFTDRDVLSTLKEIAEQRGRKNTDRAETIRTLQKLLEVSSTTYQKIRVYLALIPARLDYSQNLVSMPQDSWVAGRKEYDELVSILLENRGYVVKDVMTEEYNDMEEREPANAGDRVAIPGSLIGIFENLDNEFTKTLQHIDAHERGAEYVDRLKQEAPLYGTLVKTQVMFEREDASDALVRVIVRRLEHIYAKPDVHIDILEKSAKENCAGLQSSVIPLGGTLSASSDLIHQLAVHVYGSEAPLFRTRAILMHIYHHSMHARYHQARDLFSKSHMQDSIQQADVATQILYNRALMQFGLAAFRTGEIENCRAHMGDMISTQRYRELLGQSIQRYNQQMTPEQELLEKRRLLPFHMHVNPELLEAAYLTSCMLVEVPQLASVDTEEQRRKIASKTFKRLLDVAERSAFDGLPENTRDHVIKAARALQVGDWKRSKELLLSAKIWNLVEDSEKVKEMLANKIQIEGLRTYLFTNSAHYVSLSLSHLSEAFSLPVRTITSIVSRMIYKDELQASLDAIGQVIVFKTVEQTEIQRLSLQLADRVNALVEQNEKALDQKMGQGQQADRARGENAGGDGSRGERRGGTRGRGGRGRGRGFQGGAMGQRRVAA